MKPRTFLDKLVRKIAQPLVDLSIKSLIFLRITPNQLTIFSFLLFILPAGYFFTKGEYGWNILGLFFLLFHSYFDLCDGSLARASGQSSKLGQWLDSTLDYIASGIIIAAICYGFYQKHPTNFWLTVIILLLFAKFALAVVSRDYENSIYYSGDSGDFRKKFKKDPKMKIADWFIKEFIVLGSFPFLFLFTLRYFLLLAILIDSVGIFLIVGAIFYNIRWIIMFWAYGLAMSNRKKCLNVIKLLRKYIKD